MAVTPTSLTREFEPQPESIAAVRAFIRAHLDGAEDVVLAASELASNVVRHAGTPYSVSIDIGEVVRLEVSDGSSVLPAVVADMAGAGTVGYGLRILDTLATAWGVETRDDGKVIWVTFEAGATTSGSG